MESAYNKLYFISSLFACPLNQKNLRGDALKNEKISNYIFKNGFKKGRFMTNFIFSLQMKKEVFKWEF